MSKEQTKNTDPADFVLCTHIKKLSKKQVTEIVQNPPQITCLTHKKNIKDETICLHCGKIYCGLGSEEKCISTHQTLTEGHVFSVNLSSGDIFCSECNYSIDCQLKSHENKEQTDEAKKLKRFSQFIKENYAKLKAIYESIRVVEASSNVTYRGLQNLGNTCFLNTDLQVLSHTQKLVELYSEYKLNGNFSKSITSLKKSLPKQIEYFYDDVIEEGQNKIWHVVVAKKKQNKIQQINEKLIKTITNCKFNEHIKKLFEEMNNLHENSNGQSEPFEPSDILSFLAHIDSKYSLNEQQDAEQALLFMIDVLVQGELTTMNYDMERYHKVQKLIGRQKISPTQRVFGFYLVSQVFCQNCKKINYTFDLTYHLSIDVQTKVDKLSSASIQHHLSKDIEMKQRVYHKNLQYPQISSSTQVSSQQTLTNPALTLPPFLHSFFQEQRLTQKQNYYACSTCKSLVGLKKFYIVNLPEVLIISVKRFNHKLVKNSKHLQFQQVVDLKDVALVGVNEDGEREEKEARYQLYGVIVHQGDTIHGGHYVCFVKAKEGVWLRCSDHVVRKVTWKEVKEQQAYVLLYSKIQQNK